MSIFWGNILFMLLLLAMWGYLMAWRPEWFDPEDPYE